MEDQCTEARGKRPNHEKLNRKKKLKVQTSNHEQRPAFKSAEELGRWDEGMHSCGGSLAQSCYNTLKHSVCLYTDFSGVDFAVDAFRHAVRILAKAVIHSEHQWKPHCHREC